MVTLVNGEQCEQVSVQNRALLYGQSLFETIAIANERALLLDLHLQRLEHGCGVLGFPLDSELLDHVRSDIDRLCVGQNKSVLRVTLTLGSGGRGYRNPTQPTVTRIVTRHAYPEHPSANWQSGVTVGIATIRLALQPFLAGIKHGNRLEQVIARSQWQSDWQEALLLDSNDDVVEGTQSNIFTVTGTSLRTPPLDQCGVAGVMREFVLTHAQTIGVDVQTVPLSVSDIDSASEVFLCNSLIGVWPVKRFGKRSYANFTVTHKLLKYLLENEAIPNY